MGLVNRRRADRHRARRRPRRWPPSCRASRSCACAHDRLSAYEQHGCRSRRRSRTSCATAWSRSSTRRSAAPPASPPARAGTGRSERDGRFAPSPTGPDLHLGNLRTALLAWLFARVAARELLVRDRGPRPGARPARTTRPAARRPRRARARLGRRRSCASRSALERYARRCDAAATPTACSTLLVHARGDPRGRAAPHGPLPEGAYPGTCRELTAAQRAEREAAGRPPRCGCAPAASGSRSTTASHGARQGVVDDLVAAAQRRHARLQPRGRRRRRRPGRSARSCAATTCSTRRRVSCCCRACSGCRRRPTRTCRWCSAPTGPAGQAPRRGHARRPRPRSARRRPTCSRDGGQPRARRPGEAVTPGPAARAASTRRRCRASRRLHGQSARLGARRERRRRRAGPLHVTLARSPDRSALQL